MNRTPAPAPGPNPRPADAAPDNVEPLFRPHPVEPLIDIRGLATWLGVSEHAVRRWTAAGPDAGLAPRMLRVNGQIRFRPSDVRLWLQSKEIA